MKPFIDLYTAAVHREERDQHPKSGVIEPIISRSDPSPQRQTPPTMSTGGGSNRCSAHERLQQPYKLVHTFAAQASHTREHSCEALEGGISEDCKTHHLAILTDAQNGGPVHLETLRERMDSGGAA